MSKIIKFLDSTFLDLGRQFKWTYLPPLMVYMAAGISGLTGIVGTFFVKDYLNLSAAFLAGLGFWAGIPWALKMPLGHLVDLIWKKKNYMVYFGASLIALSLLIMYGLIIHTKDMSEVFSVDDCQYYVVSNWKHIFTSRSTGVCPGSVFIAGRDVFQRGPAHALAAVAFCWDCFFMACFHA